MKETNIHIMGVLITSFLGFGSSELLLIALAVLVYVQIAWAVVDILRNQAFTGFAKLLWIIIILIAPVLGTLIYLYYGRSPKKQYN